MLCKAQEKLNKDLVELGNWLSANKLSAKLVKTEYMILGTAPKLKSLDYSPMIKLNGKCIKRVIKSDYLGLIIDESLPWKQYISSLKLKIFSVLMAIKQVDFLPQESLITLYHSLVESRLRYCNTVWGNCGTSLKNQLSLVSIWTFCALRCSSWFFLARFGFSSSDVRCCFLLLFVTFCCFSLLFVARRCSFWLFIALDINHLPLVQNWYE